jgi:hypothetical protein
MRQCLLFQLPAPRWRPPLPLGHRAQLLKFPVKFPAAAAAPAASLPPRPPRLPQAVAQLRQAYLEQRSCQW